MLRFTVCPMVLALMAAPDAAALERTIEGHIRIHDAALGAQMDEVRKVYEDEVDEMRQRLEKIADCMSIGKYYQAGSPVTDDNGCGKSFGS
jgi:hypothetical protein